MTYHGRGGLFGQNHTTPTALDMPLLPTARYVHDQDDLPCRRRPCFRLCADDIGRCARHRRPCASLRFRPAGCGAGCAGGALCDIAAGHRRAGRRLYRCLLWPGRVARRGGSRSRRQAGPVGAHDRAACCHQRGCTEGCGGAAARGSRARRRPLARSSGA